VARILVVDDDANLRNIIAFALQREGYDVVTAGDGEQALQQLAAETPHLIILDVMMPKVDGFEVARRARIQSSVPILMLTSRAAESDKVAGLELGADDYLTKPFSPRELLARIKALLRRAGTDEVLPTQQVEVGALSIDFRRRLVQVEGKDVHLTPMEFRVLRCLAARPGEVLSNRHLVKLLHGYDCSEQEAVELMRMNIRRLRQKIEVDPAQPRFIHNVRGFGYMLGTKEAATEEATA
jgi:DNA-binding response OmpR family regulator